MKVTDFVRPTVDQCQDILKTLNMSVLLIYNCGHIIVRKDNVNYLIKNRTWNPYASDSANKKLVCSKEFIVMSHKVIKRLHNYSENVVRDIIRPGDNLIILMD